jgi:hypothetical protein
MKVEGHGSEKMRTSDDPTYGGAFRPTVYASGSNLKHGVRVVAGYNDHVVLFSIPPDTFHWVTETWLKNGHSTDPSTQPDIPEPREPVHIMGCHVDTVPRLIDLAVDSGTAMAVYAFSATGHVRVYQLEKTDATSNIKGVSRMTAMRNGELVMDR